MKNVRSIFDSQFVQELQSNFDELVQKDAQIDDQIGNQDTALRALITTLENSLNTTISTKDLEINAKLSSEVANLMTLLNNIDEEHTNSMSNHIASADHAADAIIFDPSGTSMVSTRSQDAIKEAWQAISDILVGQDLDPNKDTELLSLRSGFGTALDKQKDMDSNISWNKLMAVNAKDAVRNMLHSCAMHEIKPVFSATAPNQITIPEMTYNVNGEILTMPQTVVTLDAPDATGERDDLVFLEQWFEKEVGTNNILAKGRYRAVADVDFENYIDGFTTNVGSDATRNILPQGGNSEVPTLDEWDENTSYACAYAWSAKVINGSRINTMIAGGFRDDFGLVVAGNGDTASKAILQTYDGYCYALPLFKIRRRNSGGYSANNGNGGENYISLSFTTPQDFGRINYGDEVVWASIIDANKLEVGNVVSWKSGASCYDFKVVEIISDSAVKFAYVDKETQSVSGLWGTHGELVLISDRMDGRFANIIDESDVTHLWHKRPDDYQTMLNENFEQLIQGKLRSKEPQKMTKKYFGIDKTPIDANHVFYASLDGTTVSEIGSGELIQSITDFLPSVNGLGAKINFTGGKIEVPYAMTGTDTVDITVKAENFLSNTNGAYLVCFTGPNTTLAAVRVNVVGQLYANAFNNNSQVYISQPFVTLQRGKTYHVRIVLNGQVFKVYVNGIKVAETTLPVMVLEKVEIGHASPGYGFDGVYSDFSISNVDRGDTFATLPQDFIDGYAEIVPAFNEQRRTYADPITAQASVGITKGVGSAHSLGVSKTQATPDTWASGDTVIVKGMAGEIIGDVGDIPVVSFMNAGTKTTVTGSWSGLGTDEATFTLGTNASLVNADLEIKYTLNIEAGQGQIPVLDEVLGAEVKGQKLIVGDVALTDDFADKVSGSTVENPHIAKAHIATSLSTTATWDGLGEMNQDGIDRISALDDSLLSTSTTENGKIPQQRFSFDLIKAIEAKYGEIDAVDKVQWLKDNVQEIKFNWWGYGSGPSGNKAIIQLLRGASWTTGIGGNQTLSTSVTKLSYSTNGANLLSDIQSDGLIHFNAYTDASDGVTTSTIYTDYVSLEVKLKGKTDYVMLVPENLRRDAGQANILLVQKETKSVETMFGATHNDDITIYGLETPYQGLYANVAKKFEKIFNPKMIVSNIGTGGFGGVSQNKYVGLRNQLPLSLVDTDYELDSNGVKFNSLVPAPFMDSPMTVIGWRSDFKISNPDIIGDTGTTAGSALKRGVRGDFYFGLSDTLYGVYGTVALVKPTDETGTFATIYCGLILGDDNELYLLVGRRNHESDYSIFFDGGADDIGSFDHFKLHGRPLIKEA